ncbi:hypothetical protein SISSUDRAFT_1123005 [Sistotremastrum suecicum HHB10207 ss-3]|uniref:F-box domain-containing protein n=1 Tax=Sistotremastrum suecicum HHB10207 ss-3 TaxID=1314776 RepID=A0A165YFF1_9AGAM|nr:hypothetical protein SISSUDRAFT_1123005 [Sistotremastrum suecicum HHB10207 ss-3]
MTAMTATPMTLSSMPPEILLNIMESLSVGDIVRAAQSCSYLRAFVRSNKPLLAKAYNRAYTIHLPLGSNIENMSSELLYEHAVKSIAISTRLSKSINCSPLEPRRSITYSLEPLNTTWDETYRSGYFVRDNLLVFHNLDGLFVLLLGPSGEIEEHTRTKLNLPEANHEVAYHLSADEKSLFVLLVSVTAGEEDVMEVFEMCVAKEGFGAVTTHLDIPLPESMYACQCVAIRDPYCLVANSHSFFLVDWRAHTCGLYNPFSRKTDWILYDFQTILIHPKEPTLVIFDDDDSDPNHDLNSGIYVFDIPESLGRPLKDPLAMTTSNCYYSKTRRSLTWKSPFPSQRHIQGKMCPIGFRCLSNTCWILDVMIIGRTSISECLCWAAKPPTNDRPLVRVSFDSSDNWTAHVETIEASSVNASPDDVSSHGNHQLAGSVFSYTFSKLPVQNALQIIVPKFEDGNGNESGLIRLSVFAGLWATGSTSSDEDVLEDTWWYRSTRGPAVFDELTGRFYVRHPRGFQIIQY